VPAPAERTSTPPATRRPVSRTAGMPAALTGGIAPKRETYS